MPVQTQQIPIGGKLKVTIKTKFKSSTYDRIYDIADRLFKKHNPCNIQVKDNKTKCTGNNSYIHNYLCCQRYNDRCKYWNKGCTVKCLACKLFACGAIQVDKKNNSFIKTLSKLHRITNRYGLSNFDYYMTKEKAIRMRNKL
jgi:hypothetical protein